MPSLSSFEYGVSPADVEAAVRFECQHIKAAA
jgi:hypothetical protein